MGDQHPRWTYVVIFALLAIVVVLTARLLVRMKNGAIAPSAEQAAKNSTETNSADKDRQILDFKGEVAELRKETEANSSRVKELEARLDETSKALAASQQKLKVAQKQGERVASAPAKSVAGRVEAAPSPPRDKANVKSTASSPPPTWRRPAEPGSYEIIQDTAVLEKPSSSAREVALIQKGMTVNVVGSEGDWLQVRSKHGKPPGYIRRDDAMFRQAQGDIR
jgi:Tfp pilus assembly protein FimV